MKLHTASDDIYTSVSGAIGVSCGGLLADKPAQNEVDQHKLDREHLSSHQYLFTAVDENQGSNTRCFCWICL